MKGRRIVVGVDGSLGSREALRWAAQLVRLTGDHIVAVHALVPAGPLGGQVAAQRWHAEIAEVLELEWCRELVRSRIPFSAVVRQGEPLDALVDVAADHRAEMVVVGNRGAGATPTLGLGSTSRRAVELGRWPLLIAPEPGVGSRHLTLRRILVGIDGSPASERALDAAVDLAMIFGSRVTLLRVIEEVDVAATRPRVDAWLPLLARRLSELGVAVQTMVRRGDPAALVHEAADALDPDLLAVGTSHPAEPVAGTGPIGTGPAAGTGRMGALNRSLARATHMPTLVVPPTAPARSLAAPATRVGPVPAR